MKIFVNNKDLGFFTATSITVQRFAEIIDGERELIWCNHAGAVSEKVENQIDRIDQPDITWTSYVLVCDKCPAYKKEGEDFWEDAPFEGITYGY